MNWKIKAFIQNCISLLPSNLSYELYYMLQRKFGTLKNFNPEGRLNSGIGIARLICNSGKDVKEKVFFELGTGRAPITPLAFWLMGAKKIITVDLNPYVKLELIKDSLDYISKNSETIRSLFGDLLNSKNLDALIKFNNKETFTLKEFLEFCSIEYHAPCNAEYTALPNDCVDYYISCAVFEHIDRNSLVKIIEEGNRITSPDSLFINYIDYHDHFSTREKNISAINFLKYSDKEWKKYAGNKYMYMNRLRHDDYIKLFEDVGHEIISANYIKDKISESLLEYDKIKINKKFVAKDKSILAIKEATIVSKKTNK